MGGVAAVRGNEEATDLTFPAHAIDRFRNGLVREFYPLMR
jgi:hypothetical protein